MKDCYKKQFDKKGAKTVANHLMSEGADYVGIYPCGNHWHLTHVRKSKKWSGHRK